MVGIFAEKSISRIGVILPFHDEFERIMNAHNDNVEHYNGEADK